MKASEIREKTADELVKVEHELFPQLAQLRFRHRLGQLEKTADLKKIRKDIARVKTIMREKSKLE